ncbi:hypothetical protein [Albibacterium bauzanense]|uniref:Uncharacterized protein n=1 Tax=Albibacterium bauzanense TaxID=653929 RepID=A0A4R1M152_9SPHI|nr:hypothetical protein [Albibacterium bauzanense]TCK85658.1 hypothetical protein C8N28_0970 [Albibacterium bauzanense]
MNIKKWVTITLCSLLFVAILGVLLRYKISFSLPIINQKHLQHSHSHFALSGWLTQLLMVLLASSVSSIIGKTHFKKYNFILFANLVVSYGMLVSFLLQGYGVVSIILSTLSILIIYYFGIQLWKDMRRAPLQSPSFIWFKAAIVFSILSSLGIAMLAYIMATHTINIKLQQATTYFYLHFQYNGWFTFACLGLLIEILANKNIQIKGLHKFFWVYAVACIPAYFLSVLWLSLPLWIYIIVVISAAILITGWIWFFLQIQKQFQVFTQNLPKISKLLLGCSALAFSIKVILQAGSTIPSLNNMAFGYRPIVIGYLHLVFLGIVTLFLLGYLFYKGYLKALKLTCTGIVLFLIGIILNELMLMMQGLAAMGYYRVPYINEILLGITLLMLLGVSIINIGANKKSAQNKLE